jgi:hypothetical protein
MTDKRVVGQFEFSSIKTANLAHNLSAACNLGCVGRHLGKFLTAHRKVSIHRFCHTSIDGVFHLLEWAWYCLASGVGLGLLVIGRVKHQKECKTADRDSPEKVVRKACTTVPRRQSENSFARIL